MFAWRKGHFIFFDEGSDVAIADNGAFPFLHAENAVVHLHFKISLHLALASQSPIVFHLLTGEMSLFGVEDFSSTADHLAFALSARTLSTAGTWKIDAFSCKCAEERAALLHFYRVLSVHGNLDRPRGRKIILCHEEDDYQGENDGEEDTYARQNK